MASIVKINNKWRALIRRAGHKSICKTHPTKQAAEAWARKIEAQIDAGSKTVVLGAATVGDLIDRYRSMRDQARPILDTSNEHYQLRALRNTLGAVRLARLSAEDLVGWAQQRKDEGAGPYTINCDLSKLGTVMRYAGLGMDLPDVVQQARPLLHHLGLIGGGGKRERRPTLDEIERILAVAPDWLGDMIRFAIATAMRRGEIVRLLWADLDQSRKVILVRDRKHPRKKVGNNEEVPLLSEAWEIIQRRLAQRDPDEPRVFPHHEQTVSKYFTNLCRDLDIPDLHFHDLRHEGASRLFEAGFAIQEVALVTGHKDWRHLRRYTNLRADSLPALEEAKRSTKQEKNHQSGEY